MTVNLLDTDVPGALDLATQDDGGVYLARSKYAKGNFFLGVKDRYRQEKEGQDEAEVLLDRTDLLALIAHAAKLLAEDEVG